MSILVRPSIASSDPQKITDIIIKKNAKAPFDGVIVHEDMYRYLRGEEQRAIDLETQIMTSNEVSKTSKYNFMVPLSIGMVVGIVGATYLKNQDAFVPLGIGVISGGLIAWSFQ